ncbi:MAG: hypothetical protein IPO87_09935 [Flavobacteriales bacterium]|nr:hypothetical protein [Flavobacteriales bacterium]
MPTANTKGKRMDLAFAALLSDDDEQVLTALTRIEKEGDSNAIPPLLRSLISSKENRVKQRITNLLYQVKASDAGSVLLMALDNPEFKTVRPTILATFWNAGVDMRDHLDRFVEIGINGTADESFECLTVIENQEIWPEKAVREALVKLKGPVASETDPYKASMLNDLISVLRYRIGKED